MKSSKCVLHISLDTIKENYLVLKDACPGSETGAAVKANCYGLGMKQTSPVLKKAGCKHFFVANIEEGISLRKILGLDINIYVLNGVFADETKIFKEYGLVPVLNHLVQIKVWQEFALKLNHALPCFIHFDTGMNRLGMPEIESSNLVQTDAYGLDVLCVISHLISSEDPDNLYNKKQLEKFTKLAKKFPEAKRSLAGSSGIFLGSDYHFDLVRPGAALYGINPTPWTNDSKIKNPVQLFAPIIQVHQLQPGESVGYDSTYTNSSMESCSIATIPIGYADGFFRSLSNKFAVYINGRKAPVIGRVSMDLAVIDVSGIPQKDVFLGQKVEVIGNNCTPDVMAAAMQTNAHEILTRLGDRFDRIYT
jgi:alanine racemase